MGKEALPSGACSAFPTVTSLVDRRVKLQGALRQVVKTPGGQLGNDLAPNSHCGGTDPKGSGDVRLGFEVSDGGLFEHNAKLSMPSLEMQPCLASQSLSLLYMSSQAWKRCETLADRLAWAIEHANVSQADLAAHLKISTAAMSEWFTGKVKNPKLKNIHRAAQFCKVYGWWLAIGEGSPYDGIGAEFEGISGQDLLIAKGLSQLADSDLRGTVQELISARKANQEEKSQKKRKA